MTSINISEETHGQKGRYVARIADGPEAELRFTWQGPGRLSLDHVGVPRALKGKGVGGALVEHAVGRARAGGYKLIPRCSFAAAQFKRHAEWSDVIDRQRA
jgi:hypothetical protein